MSIKITEIFYNQTVYLLNFNYIISWSHVTSHMIDPTWSGQFQTIINPAYLEVDLVISHLTYLINLSTFRSTFRINFLNQLLESTYAISLLIKSAAPLAYSMLLLPNVRM